MVVTNTDQVSTGNVPLAAETAEVTFLLPSPNGVVLDGSSLKLRFSCPDLTAPLLLNTEAGCRFCFSTLPQSPRSHSPQERF